MRPAGEGEEERGAQTVDIGTRVGGKAVGGLLGGGEILRADTLVAEDHGHGEFVAGIPFAEHGQSEVEQADVSSAVDEQVLRLDVAVYDAATVDVIEREGRLADELAGLSPGEAMMFLEDFEEIGPFDELHRHVREAAGDTQVMCLDDVRVLQQKADAGFLLKAGEHSLIVFETFGENLQGDGVAGGGVPRLVDAAHAADAEDVENLVLVEEEAAGPAFKEPVRLKPGQESAVDEQSGQAVIGSLFGDRGITLQRSKLPGREQSTFFEMRPKGREEL